MRRIAFALCLVWASFVAAPVRAEPPAQEGEVAQAAPPLDLNRATEAELDALPGIGPAKAQAILAFREAHGGFTSVSQLLRIKGFGRATLRKLRPLLTVAPAGPVAEARVR